MCKEFAILAVPFAFEFVEGDEAQRRRIDAIAQAACVARAVAKHVTQMAVPVACPHFGTGLSVADVGFLFYVFGFHWLGEARPAAVTIELVERRKKRLARNDIDVEAWFMVIPKSIFKRPLSSVLLCHPELFGRQTRYRLRVFLIFGHLNLYLTDFTADDTKGSTISLSLHTVG